VLLDERLKSLEAAIEYNELIVDYADIHFPQCQQLLDEYNTANSTDMVMKMISAATVAQVEVLDPE
jgi:hypothetical protein